RGDILGILSVDNWEKPLADNPDLSEPIFTPGADSQQKIKSLKMFAQLSGLAMQRIDFKRKEQGIDNLQESEAILREILHGLRNKIMKIRGYLTRIEAKETKQKVKESAEKINYLFASLVLRVKGSGENLKVDSVLRPGALIDRVLQIIEESVVLIRSHDPEKVNALFQGYTKQLRDAVRNSGNAASQQQQDFWDFLDDFKKLAVYQAGLFGRREELFVIHQEIQKSWQEIERNINSLLSVEDADINSQERKNLTDILMAYTAAKEDYDKYIDLCNDLASRGFLQRSLDYQKTDINELMKVIDDRWLSGKLESGIRIDNDLPKVIVDSQIFLSVFDELIMNAEKYGGSSVSIDVSMDKKQKDFARIDFTTAGRGIAEDEWEKVFLDEYRVVKDDGLGTGLGLYAVRKNLERMGGKISITKSVLKSDNQKGSVTFSIEIPVVNEASLIKDDFSKTPLLNRKNINKNSLIAVSI
ncbi:MAG: hypothetical protein KKD05_08870, partial [Candidatus Omnitrophica bacterium]|nr:hypothetical protein [Candidatus Omnitrophota bacterium]